MYRIRCIVVGLYSQRPNRLCLRWLQKEQNTLALRFYTPNNIIHMLINVILRQMQDCPLALSNVITSKKYYVIVICICNQYLQKRFQVYVRDDVAILHISIQRGSIWYVQQIWRQIIQFTFQQLIERGLSREITE